MSLAQHADGAMEAQNSEKPCPQGKAVVLIGKDPEALESDTPASRAPDTCQGRSLKRSGPSGNGSPCLSLAC